MSKEETALKKFNEHLFRVSAMLDRLEGWKKSELSPELRERVLALAEKIKKHAVDILERVEKLESGLKP